MGTRAVGTISPQLFLQRDALRLVHAQRGCAGVRYKWTKWLHRVTPSGAAGRGSEQISNLVHFSSTAEFGFRSEVQTCPPHRGSVFV